MMWNYPLHSRTLVIGVGGYGCREAEKLQKLCKGNDSISFLGIDMQCNEEHELHNMICLACHSLHDSHRIFYGCTEWYDDANPNLQIHLSMGGSGGVRMLARLAFEEAVYRDVLYQKLSDSLNDFLSGENTAKQIIIVCSLAGGTGSGIFLPLAFYLKHFISTEYNVQHIPIKGFFAIPEIAVPFAKDSAKKSYWDANTYAALAEMKALNRSTEGEKGSAWYLKVNDYVYNPKEYGLLYDRAFMLDTQKVNQKDNDAAHCIYAYIMDSCAHFTESNLAAATNDRMQDIGFLYETISADVIAYEESPANADKGRDRDLERRLTDCLLKAKDSTNHRLRIDPGHKGFPFYHVLFNPNLPDETRNMLENAGFLKAMNAEIMTDESIPVHEIYCLTGIYGLIAQESRLLNDDPGCPGILYTHYLKMKGKAVLHIDKRIGTRFGLPLLTGRADDPAVQPQETAGGKPEPISPDDKSAGYAFISYSHKQKAAVDAIREYLNRNGIRTWMAPGDIPPGSKYAAEINRAIKQCACFVLMLTNDAQESLWVGKEVERAINYRKTIIPVQLEKVILNDQFELYISTDQMLAVEKIDDQSEEIRQLLAVVKDCIRERKE